MRGDARRGAFGATPPPTSLPSKNVFFSYVCYCRGVIMIIGKQGQDKYGLPPTPADACSNACPHCSTHQQETPLADLPPGYPAYRVIRHPAHMHLVLAAPVSHVLLRYFRCLDRTLPAATAQSDGPEHPLNA